MVKMMRKNIHLPDELIEQISEWRHLHKYKSETAAIIDLINAGLLVGKNQYVYLAESKDGQHLKIGYTTNVYDRLQNVRSPNGEKCKCIALLSGGRHLERIAHKTWSSHSVSGEWFENSPRIKRWFEDHPLFIENVDPEATVNNNVCLVKISEEQQNKIKDCANFMGFSVAEFMRWSAISIASKKSLQEVMRSTRAWQEEKSNG